MSTKKRAQPMAPDARRKAIVEAVIPLLLDQGANTTTAQMARAAGIAEGTIFRVFPDKRAILRETCRASFDSASTVDQLAAIERELPLEVKLRKAAAIILQRSERIHAVTGVLRSMPHPGGHDASHLRDTYTEIVEANSQIFRGLTALFASESEGLAVEPARAAAAFRGLLHAVSFPLSDPYELITAYDAIEILLNGVTAKETV